MPAERKIKGLRCVKKSIHPNDDCVSWSLDVDLKSRKRRKLQCSGRGSRTIPDSVGFQCGYDPFTLFSVFEEARIIKRAKWKWLMCGSRVPGRQDHKRCLGKFGRSTRPSRKPMIFFVVSCVLSHKPGAANQRLRHEGSAIVHLAFLVKWIARATRAARPEITRIGSSPVLPTAPCLGSHWA